MDWKNELYRKNEQPLERLVEGYSYTSIFRKIAFIGDSLSSGEFETEAKYGEKRWHDMIEYSWGQYPTWSRTGISSSRPTRGKKEDMPSNK